MGLLDKLWDDVVAGPKPSEGLGKLRRRVNPFPDLEDEGIEKRRQSAEFRQFEQEAQRVVSKSIPVPKRPGSLVVETTSEGSLPSTPSGSSPLASPSLASPASRMRSGLFRQCNSAFATHSDLVVISALDK